MGEGISGLPDYLKKECEYLRTRLSSNIDETALLERYAIMTTGGLWAWTGTHTISVGTALLPWLPLMLTMFLGFRALAVYFRIKTLRTYLAKIEAAANLPQGMGWVTSHEVGGARYRMLTAFLFWSAINLLNLAIALILQYTEVFQSVIA